MNDAEQRLYEESAADAPVEQPTAETARELPPRVTMPLLTLLTQESLDQGYRVAAERRQQRVTDGEPEPSRRGAMLATTIAVAVFGILVTVAAVQTSRNADVEALGKASLAQRIQSERASVRELQKTRGSLLDANRESDAELRELRETENQLTSRVSRLGVGTGYLAVRGPGIRVTVDDAPGATRTTAVQDEDLVVLVDGLWAAGAEAIAINGQRLTVLSSIANSGQTIHVNVRPINPPYVVEAIGDPNRMEGRLLASTSGSLFYSVARTLGFAFSVQDDDNLELPPARVRPLRWADAGSAEDRQVDQEEVQQ